MGRAEHRFHRGATGPRRWRRRRSNSLILTAVRAGEALGATWSEIDLDGQAWTIPAIRMKAGREHRVPLSPQGFGDPRGHAEDRPGVPGPERRQALGRHVFRQAHGADGRQGGRDLPASRSTFRDWCGGFPTSRASSPSKHWRTRSAMRPSAPYRRGDALEKRRALMDAWAAFAAAGLWRPKVRNERAARDRSISRACQSRREGCRPGPDTTPGAIAPGVPGYS